MKIIVNNLAIEYRDEGQGPVMLILHGWQDDLRTFDTLTAQLKSGWRIVRLDLPGFGGSEPPPAAWRIDDYVGLVSSFITKLNLDADILIGHSLGCRIIIKGAANGKLTARKLVLMAAAGIAKSKTLRNRSYKAVAKVGKVLTLLPPLVFWRQQLRQKLYQQAGSDYLGAGSLQQTFLNIINEDLQAAATHITQPTLLIWGDADSQTPLADGHRLARLIPDALLKSITGADHFVHQSHPGQAARLIREFVR